MIAIILLNANAPAAIGTPAGYFIGALIALLILGYLIYSLIKPEKF
jgi:K+-transporting ATPase KdpF subunit